MVEETVTVMMSSPGHTAGRAVTVPRRIGHVKLGESLGKGASGVVFAAHDEMLNRRVAVKFMHRLPAAPNDAELTRFIEGVRSAARIKHPNIVMVHNVDSVDGLPMIVMEYIDGVSLRDLLRAHGAFDLPLATYVMRCIAAGVEALHEQRVVHRDLKPANVMFDLDGGTHVCDFGLACQLSSASTVAGSEGISGTPLYMAPETFESVVSPQGDVYALGVMLFEMLTGRTPFSADSWTEMKRCHVEAPPPVQWLSDLSAPEGLAEVIERAMHKTRIMRYKSAGHLLRALEQLVSSQRDELLKTRLSAIVVTCRGASGPYDARPPQPDVPAANTFDLVARKAREKRGGQP